MQLKIHLYIEIIFKNFLLGCCILNYHRQRKCFGIKYRCKVTEKYDSTVCVNSNSAVLTVSSSNLPSEKDVAYAYFKTKINKSEEKEEDTTTNIDRDTYKSELPSKSVLAVNLADLNLFFDMKVHAADEKTNINQELLVQNLVSPNANILLTKNIYPRRDLGMDEEGEEKILTWNNVLDVNGTVVFNGFKLRSASTITICK